MKAFVSTGIVALTLLTGSSAHSATLPSGIGHVGVVEPNPIRWSFVRPNPRGYGAISPNPRLSRGAAPTQGAGGWSRAPSGDHGAA